MLIYVFSAYKQFWSRWCLTCRRAERVVGANSSLQNTKSTAINNKAATCDHKKKKKKTLTEQITTTKKTINMLVNIVTWPVAIHLIQHCPTSCGRPSTSWAAASIFWGAKTRLGTILTERGPLPDGILIKCFLFAAHCSESWWLTALNHKAHLGVLWSQ